MRLRALLFALVVLAGAALAAVRLGGWAAEWYEARTAARLTEAFTTSGQRWASAKVDGLKVRLEGMAPDETSRFRAVEIARQVVSAERIEDATTLVAAKPLPPAPFALELLRNDAEISLIGLVPETGGRDVIRSALGAGGLSEHVTDMLESASDPAPAGWPEALGFGLSVLAELPRAKISVAPGNVKVIAVADSDPAKGELEARLKRAVPGGVTLGLEISAPRPVIAPFAFDFSLGESGASLAACSAETPDMAGAILAAARAAGLEGEADCSVGLGAPSPDWAAAVSDGIDALKALGGGRFTLRDLAAELTAPEGTPATKLAEVAATLGDALPDVFQLGTVMPPRMEIGTGGERVYAPRFRADLRDDGTLRLSGALKDATARQAVESYAAALFGHDHVVNDTVADAGLPEGWPARVLAGVEALASLKEGTLEVSPEEVAVEGWGLDENVSDKVKALLASKVGAAAVVDVTFNAEAAAADANALRPRPEICADQINAILDAGSIRFAAGSADIVPESRGVIAAIADVLRGCPGSDFEIGGHTDSHGSAEVNQRLSDERAQAVLAALRQEDLPLVGLTAQGFGAADPIADNETVAGRAKNRRIEFTLVAPEGVEELQSPAEETPGPGEEGAAANAAEQAATPDDGGAADCAAQVGEALGAGSSIQFSPGSSTIAPESEAVVAAVGDVLRGCPDARMEIGGYTDSQGSDSGNLDLSQSRAQAVLDALRAPDLPLPNIVARGYGEANPVADNDTEEGRAQNRRIEFKPLAPVPEATAPDGEAAGAGGTDAACGSRIDAILAEDSIQFEPGSATISAESDGTLDEIAEVLKSCPAVAIEIGGHTDSQGSESGNERLSQERADAVLAALRTEGLPLPGVTARGYGESEPVADNGTAEGRAQNRRIVFTLGDPGEAATVSEEGEGDGSE